MTDETRIESDGGSELSEALKSAEVDDVDFALSEADKYSRWKKAYERGAARDIDYAQWQCITLAAEVRRLREERDEVLRDARAEVAEGVWAIEGMFKEAQAKLARVEALPAKWVAHNAKLNRQLQCDELLTADRCADELEAALRDEPLP